MVLWDVTNAQSPIAMTIIKIQNNVTLSPKMSSDLYFIVRNNWCFWTVVLEKTFESPLDCKEIQPVYILKEISPEYSLEVLMLKLKLQYFGHLMWRTDSLAKTLMLSLKTEGRRRRGQQKMRWLDGISNLILSWVSSGSWWWSVKLGILQSMRLQRVGHNWATELNWLI